MKLLLIVFTLSCLPIAWACSPAAPPANLKVNTTLPAAEGLKIAATYPGDGFWHIKLSDPWTKRAPDFMATAKSQLLVAAMDLAWVELLPLTELGLGEWKFQLPSQRTSDSLLFLQIKPSPKLSPFTVSSDLVTGSIAQAQTAEDLFVNQVQAPAGAVNLARPAAVRPLSPVTVNFSGSGLTLVDRLIVLAAGDSVHEALWLEDFAETKAETTGRSFTGSFPRPGIYRLWLVPKNESGTSGFGFYMKVEAAGP